MQMVSVLALNKLELKEMIDAEMVENPVLEEIDESVPMLDEVAGRQERNEREERLGLLDKGAEEPAAAPKDPFNEIDFGSYFQEYLDPGYRTQPEYEDSEKPSFENFLSQPTTLVRSPGVAAGSSEPDPELHDAAEFVIGNLDEDGYLAASEEELAAAYQPVLRECARERTHASIRGPAATLELVRRGIDLVQHLDPAGVGARDLRECLLIQIAAQQHEFDHVYAKRPARAGREIHIAASKPRPRRKLEERRRSMEVAALIVDRHLHLLQKRDLKDLARAAQMTLEEAHAGMEFIRTLDPRPGRLYNREQTRLIEPDVVFLKRGGEWVVSMNEEDLPSLRLSQRYRRMLVAEDTDKEVKEYVKERFRSAHAADAQHRAAQEHDPAHLRSDCSPPAGVSRQGRRGAAAHDDQGSGRGDRRSPLDGEPRGGQQICAHAAGRAGAALLLLRGLERSRGRRHAVAGAQAQGAAS